MSFVETKRKLDAESIKKWGVIDTIKTGMRIVSICDIPVGVAYSDEDEKNMRDALAHFGILDTRGNVLKAMQTMQDTVTIATDLRNSGMNVEKEFINKSGKRTFLIEDKLYDESGNIVAE